MTMWIDCCPCAETSHCFFSVASLHFSIFLSDNKNTTILTSWPLYDLT